MEWKEGNGINDKGKLKNQMLQIRMIMQKFHMIVRNELEKENWLQAKEDV